MPPKHTLLQDRIHESNKQKMKLLDGSVGNMSAWKAVIGCRECRYNQLTCIISNLHVIDFISGEKIYGVREEEKKI